MGKNGITSEQGLIGLIIVTIFIILMMMTQAMDVTPYSRVYGLFFILSLIYYKIIPNTEKIFQESKFKDLKFYSLLILVYMISATASSVLIIMDVTDTLIAYSLTYFILIFLLFPYKHIKVPLEHD